MTLSARPREQGVVRVDLSWPSAAARPETAEIRPLGLTASVPPSRASTRILQLPGASTQSSASWRVAGLPVGSYALQILPSGRVVDFQIAEGRETQLALSCAPLRERAITVWTPEGDLAPLVLVEWVPVNDRPTTADWLGMQDVFGPSNPFVLRTEPGDLLLQVQAPNYGTQTFQVREGTTTVQLSRVARLLVKFRNAGEQVSLSWLERVRIRDPERESPLAPKWIGVSGSLSGGDTLGELTFDAEGEIRASWPAIRSVGAVEDSLVSLTFDEPAIVELGPPESPGDDR